MADVSAETVLEAAIVSTAELSFLLHAASANAAMASVATLYPDPFLNISFSLPQGRERGRSIVAAPFVFGGVSGKKRTHHPLLVIAFAPRGQFGLSPDVVPNPCFLLQFPVRVRKARRRTPLPSPAVMRTHLLFITALLPAVVTAQKAASPDALRPITFLDRQYQRDVGSPTPSPDGKWLVYTLSTPDWNQARRQTDIYLVSVKEGLASTKQMTFTKDKNETSPRWARDGKFFVFLSNRDAPAGTGGGATGGGSGGGNAAGQNQIYIMRPDGGE